jgi:hypothetical protein
MSAIRTTSVDRKPAVLPGEHGGSRRSVEQVSEPQPADHAAAYSLGEHGQVDLSDRAGSFRRLGIMWDTGGREQESLELGPEP